MNKSRHWMRLCALFFLIPAGCFGGKVQPFRPEAQVRAESALTRGISAGNKGDYPEAETLLSESLSRSSSIEDYAGKTIALIHLARIYRQQHDLQKAEASIDLALSTVQFVSQLSAEVAYEKALLELAKKSPTTALEWAKKAITAEQGNALGRRLNLAGRIQLVLGAYNDAKKLTEQALSENRTSGQKEEEANSLRILGIVARSEKNYRQAEQYLYDALHIDKQLGKSAKIAVDLGALAETARESGNLKGAAIYLERAYDINLAGMRLQEAGENQNMLADLYALAGEELKAARAKETAQKLVSRGASQIPGGPSETIKPSNRP